MEAFIAENGHNSRNNLALDASSPAVFDPLIEQVVIVEELRDDKVGACINLIFQIPDIILTGLCLKMYLWITCNTNAEEVAILLFDEFHQVDGIVETILNGNPVCGSTRGVASQSEEVLNSKFLRLVERLENFLSSHIRASYVHQDVET